MRVLLPAVLAVCVVALQGAPTEAAGGVATVISPDGLNLRSAPSTQATVVAVIPYSSILTLTGNPTPDGWYPVSFGNLAGWAYGDYLTQGLVNPSVAQNSAPLAPGPANPPAAPVAAAPVPPIAPAAQGGAASPASVSPAPPSASALPGSAPSAPAVSAAAAPSAAAGASATTPAASATSPSLTLMVTTDALNLRATPDPNGAIELTMPPGSNVQLMGTAAFNVNNWDPITYNGASGWADAAYLSAASGSAGTGAASVSSSTPLVSTAPLSAAQFGSPTLGAPAGPETGLPVAAAPPGTQGKFIWPVTMHKISTVFQPVHQAIDIDQFPSGGNPVRAIADGIITFAGGDACCSYGLYVIIQHAGGFSSLYAHFSKLEVSQGQLVHQGQELGLSGCTGNCTGPHVHFAIYLNGNPLDPLSVLPPDMQIESGASCYRAC